MIKRIVSVLLVITMMISIFSGCGISKKKVNGETSNIRKSVSENVSQAKDKAGEMLSKIDLGAFKKGWNYASKFVSTIQASKVKTKYIEEVGKEIENLKDDINQSRKNARGIAQEAGFVAEKWAAGTFNINAVKNGSKERAKVVGSNGYGSVDIETTYGENISSKFYKKAKDSARQQAKTIKEDYLAYRNNAINNGKDPISESDWMKKHGYNFNDFIDLLTSVYDKQTRLIPKGQEEEAVKFLIQKSEKLKNKGDLESLGYSKAAIDALENIKSRIEAPDGTTSIGLSYDDAQVITELAKEGKFDPFKFGISITELVEPKYILKQATVAGVEGAALDGALVLAFDSLYMIDEAIQTGAISKETLEDSGIDALLESSESFITGLMSNLITVECQSGVFGEAFKNAASGAVALLTILAVDSIRYSYYLARGEISEADYGNFIAEEIFVLTSSGLFGITAKALLPLPGMYIAGSIIGSMLATQNYDSVKEIALELKDGNGFVTVVPEGTVSTTNVYLEELSNTDISKALKNVKDIFDVKISEGKILVTNK